MKNRILITGHSGQLGLELASSLASLGDILTPNSQEFNLSQPEQLRDYLDQHRPNFIVNAAAYTAVDAAETHADLAYAINQQAPAVLAAWCQAHQATLVQYSTDYVFGDTQAQPYDETAITGALNTYGASKAAGEMAVRTALPNHYIFRVSWLYSATGNNFLRTMLRLAQERTQLSIVHDQIGAPTSCRLVADVTAHVLLAQIRGQTNHFGTYHLTAKGAVSWYDFTQYIVKTAIEANLPLTLTPKNIKPIPSSDYPTPAQRPRYSCLDCNKIETTFGLTLPDWRLGVRQATHQLLRSKL